MDTESFSSQPTHTFHGVNRERSTFRDVDFSRSTWESVNLRQIDVRNCDLSGATFTDCQFSGATIDGDSLDVLVQRPRATLLSVHPVGDTDPMAIPVKSIGPALAFYTSVLGFEISFVTDNAAILQRDDVTIGLAVNGTDPEQASLYFSIDDVDLLHQEFHAKHLQPTPIRIDRYSGKSYRVFFVQEPFGVCFVFGRPIETTNTLLPN